MKIAYISTEIYPFAKVGGLADVASALPNALKENGCNITLFMPLYKQINKDLHIIKKDQTWDSIDITLGDKSYSIDLFFSNIKTKNEEIPIFFIENEQLFGRDGIYTDKDGNGFIDNHIRDIFFSRAVVEVIRKKSIDYDIIHLNDSHTALIAPYIKTIYASDQVFKNTKVVLTIHNIGKAYQGIHEPVEISLAGLSYDFYYAGGPYEFYKKFNFLKAGILFSDAITTVSPTYSKEIQTDKFGEGLNGVLIEVKDRLLGILNGIDTDVWNPEKDNNIKFNYGLENIKKGKLENKKALLKIFGWSARKTKAPIISMITRLVEQKGLDLVIESFEELMKKDVKFILLGTGQDKYQNIFSEFAKKYPEKVRVELKYDDKLAHLIEAGSDIFLMPSKYEPCGLNQLYSLKYGTVPVVRGVGGLEDSIINYNSENKTGNGFKFKEYSSEIMLKTLNKALTIYNDKNSWLNIIEQGMREDLSWKMSAENYLNLYKKLFQ